MSQPFLTVGGLSSIIAARLCDPALRNVWVAGELSDVRVSGGHCYLELADKDRASGRVSAKVRGAIWANIFSRLAMKFSHATGRQIAAGMKVMVCGTVNYHPAFGLTFLISDIDPSYTMGEAERRRREILEQLQADGTINMNRQLPWNIPAQRIAVVSAAGAAGYGDFINQLFSNPQRLRFNVRLFPAVMQGERTVPSVMAALDAIAADSDSWDCVVIIRGGGATNDLLSFDDYNLASTVAQFPIPVIVGIGHERDITVLDYVANMRVKTPTAAAEWLIAQAVKCLDRLRQLGADILATATDTISGCRARLAYCEGSLPTLAQSALTNAQRRIERTLLTLAGLGARRIAPELARLRSQGEAIARAATLAIERQRTKLDSDARMLDALSPQATLRRGYSITRVGGHAVRSAAELRPGTVITTTFADGEITSVTNEPS